MKKKKSKKKSSGIQQSPVKLSLYMIVKNEEKNIEKALGWAKDVTFEQIVVDTGSTDRTVEIAKRMGAKVYHFEWINDFATARNFALEQATGNWITGVDADEYMTVEDAKKILTSIKWIQSNREAGERYLAVSGTAINLDDNGRPTSSLIRICAFRNDPAIRFSGRIHERLFIDEKQIFYIDGIKVYHTGYSETAKKEAGKSERNVKMLRAELERNPSDINIKAYLADSLSSLPDEKSRNEAASLFEDVLNSSAFVYDILKMKAYVFFIHTYLNDSEKLLKCEEMCKKALEEFPNTLDFEYFLGHLLNKKEEYNKAWEQLKKCEMMLTKISDNDKSYLIPDNPVMLYGQIMIAAHGLGDAENVVLYSTMILSIDNTRQEVLSSCISTLLRCGASYAEVTGLLSQLYDFKNNNELQLIKHAAEDCGAIAFFDKLMQSTD